MFLVAANALSSGENPSAAELSAGKSDVTGKSPVGITIVQLKTTITKAQQEGCVAGGGTWSKADSKCKPAPRATTYEAGHATGLAQGCPDGGGTWSDSKCKHALTYDEG